MKDATVILRIIRCLPEKQNRQDKFMKLADDRQLSFTGRRGKSESHTNEWVEL